MDEPKLTQSDKLREAARDLECDEGEARWEEWPRKATRQKVPGQPE